MNIKQLILIAGVMSFIIAPNLFAQTIVEEGGKVIMDVTGLKDPQQFSPKNKVVLFDSDESGLFGEATKKCSDMRGRLPSRNEMLLMMILQPELNFINSTTFKPFDKSKNYCIATGIDGKQWVLNMPTKQIVEAPANSTFQIRCVRNYP